MKDQQKAALISKIYSHVDVPSEEDVIMKYNPTEDSSKTEMEKLVSSLEDRKGTFIYKLKGQDCKVVENEVEEDKEQVPSKFSV